MLNSEKRLIILLVIAVSVIGASVSLYQIAKPPDAKVAHFIDASIVGPSFGEDGIPTMDVGQFATITVNVEKLESKPVEDILIRTYFENPVSKHFLYIDGKSIHPGIDNSNLSITGEKIVGNKVDPFGGKDTTGAVIIKVIATDKPHTDYRDTINVVLIADGVEIDRKSFDVIVNSNF